MTFPMPPNHKLALKKKPKRKAPPATNKEYAFPKPPGPIIDKKGFVSGSDGMSGNSIC